MQRPEIIQILKQKLESLPYDMELWIYGSEARSDARPDSDIDLLVLFNKPRVDFEEKDRVFDVTSTVELESGVLINPFVVSKQQWESRMTPFRDNVENDRKRL